MNKIVKTSKSCGLLLPMIILKVKFKTIISSQVITDWSAKQVFKKTLMVMLNLILGGVF